MNRQKKPDDSPEKIVQFEKTKPATSMKKWLLLLGLASACSSADAPAEKATTQAATCPEISEPIMATSGKQVREYYTVPGFNPKSKECWEKLRAAAKESGKASGSGATIIAFIDAETFTPGKDGMYDEDDKVRDKVIAQVLVNNDAGLYEFTPDPFAGGKYTEPK